jgi:hypothetical protein
MLVYLFLLFIPLDIVPGVVFEDIIIVRQKAVAKLSSVKTCFSVTGTAVKYA